ncbi:hypothetical protein [Calidifontibacillus erzurumensis]|uniref:hypothetical protein n=1 Tax=Calidifontibacillus erzurumensis TaxID=2741433 RepID=UPI0035B54EFB
MEKDHKKTKSAYKDQKIICFQTKKEQLQRKFHIEVKQLIDELMDRKQQTVAWLLYYSMKDHYSLDAIGFCLELWCSYCDEIDPIIDDERKYAASIELFVSNLLDRKEHSKYDILYKYGLHKMYDPLTIKL